MCPLLENGCLKGNERGSLVELFTVEKKITQLLLEMPVHLTVDPRNAFKVRYKVSCLLFLLILMATDSFYGVILNLMLNIHKY